MKKYNILFVLITLFNNNFAQTESSDKLEFWENPSDSIPKIILKRVISEADLYEYGLAILTDNGEIFYTEELAGLMIIMKSMTFIGLTQIQWKKKRGIN